MLTDVNNIVVDHLKNPYQRDISVSVLRLDLVHPVISGNKWFKLTGYLNDAVQQNKKTLLTFGGAYSNHIVATAAAAKEKGLSSIGIIRGEEGKSPSHTLDNAREYGMDIVHTSRSDYALKKIPGIIWDRYEMEDVYIINEGGYGVKGILGITELINSPGSHYTHMMTAAGTGTTLAGMVASRKDAEMIGIAVLKNEKSLAQEVNAILPPDLQDSFTVLHEYHFGGYAKKTNELIDFMNRWYEQTGIPSDFVYTGKMFYAAEKLARENYFPPGANILLIHTGGLQGNRSLGKGSLIF